MPDLIDVDEFFADPQFANPSISPDGTRITYLAPDQGGGRDGCAASTRTTPTRSASLATSAAASPHTTGPTTPAGCFYLQDVDGNEDWHLHRGDLDDPDDPTADRRSDAHRRGLTRRRCRAVPPVPGTVLVTMNRRSLFFDVFRVEVPTGETTLHFEEDDPTGEVLFDRDGAPAFHTALAPRRHRRVLLNRACHRAAATAGPHGGPRRPLRRRPPARRGGRPRLRRDLQGSGEVVRRCARHPVVRRGGPTVDPHLRPRPRPRRHLVLRPRHRRGPVAVPLPPPQPHGPGPR